MKTNNIFKLIASILVCESAGAIGALFTTPSVATWYAGIARPPLSPPNWVFGPVWTLLFALLGVALFLVWKSGWRVKNPVLAGKGRRAWNPVSERLWSGDWQKANIIALFSVQYVLNVLWSFLFFGLHLPGLAFFELLALLCSIVYVMVNFYRVSKAAAWLLLPYLLWVTFAGLLNFMIWTLN